MNFHEINICLFFNRNSNHTVIINTVIDVMNIISGLKLARSIGDSLPFKKFGSHFHSRPVPGCHHHVPDSHDYLRCYVKTLATTDHHPIGTCRMSPDPEYGVVDPQFRVYGVRGLRVIDGSTMPKLVTGNINIPIMMMAERGADFIKHDYLYQTHENVVQYEEPR